MNLKKLLSFVLVLLLLGTITQAQTTFYVDSQIGSDGRNGLSATIPNPDDGITGPKLTVTNAMTAAVNGDVISINNTGINYPEAGVTVTKQLTFTSTNGTPIFTGATGLVINENQTGNVAFTGPIRFNGGLTLTQGAVDGGTNLTIGTQVIRANAGSVNGQINYTGVVNFTYNLTANLTTGDEFTPATNTTTANNFTVTGAFTLTLRENKTVNGVVTTAGPLDLGTSGTLAILGANAHTFGGNVTDGTLAFTLSGAASVAGVGAPNLNHVTATKSTAGVVVLTVAASINNVDNVTAGGNASITLSNAGDVDDVTNNGAGTILASNAAGTMNNVTNTGSGTITMGTAAALAVTGNVTQSGSGLINLNAGVTGVNVTGNVALTSTVTFTTAGVTNGSALISFNVDVATTITGSVTNSATLAGSQDDGANAGNAVITFASATTALTVGAVTNSVASTAAETGAASNINGNGQIIFSNTTGALVTGNISNSANIANGSATVFNNGQIVLGGVGAFTLNAVATTSTLTNTSVSDGSNGNGDIIHVGTGGVWFASVSSSGAAGGDILLGNANTAISGSVTNSRTSATAVINFGNAAGAYTLTIAGNLVSSGSAVTRSFSTTGAIGVTGQAQVSGGTVTLDNTTAGVTFGGVALSGGTINVASQGSAGGALSLGVFNVTGGTFNRGTTAGATTNVTATQFILSGGTVNLVGTAGAENFNVNGNITMTNGTLNLSLMDVFYTNGTSIQIGDANNNPTFTNEAACTFTFDQPIPNVLQVITIGNQIPEWDGPFSIINPAALAKVVEITGGNFRVNNTVTINNGAVNNATNINGAKIWIGKNNPGGTTGNFVNTTGYTTENDGRIVMQGNAQQTVTFGAGASFGSFEVDNNAGTAAPGADVFFTTDNTDEANATFTAFFYLAEGSVEGQDVTFNNATTFPTIVRNEGTFLTVPTFSSFVNVSYIGGINHVTANEMPVAANRLWNLTVATSNSPTTAGRATVTVIGNTTVNGTLEVKNNQGLFIPNGITVSLNGTTVNLNTTGIIGNNTTGLLAFVSTTGTAVTGGVGSLLPDVNVGATSAGNTITGIDALANNYFGADGTFNGNESAVGDGVLTFLGAPGTGSLTTTFNQNHAAVPNTDANLLADLSNATVNSTWTLGANVRMSGILVANSGTVDVGSNTLFVDGLLGHIINGSATVTGSGKLRWQGAGNTQITIPGSDATLSVGDYEVAVGAGNDLEIFTNDLILTGNVTVTSGNMVLGSQAPGPAVAQNITVTGSALTMTGNGAIPGTGILILNPGTPPLTFSFTGTPNISNLTQLGDVTLAGTGAGLTITGTYLHTSGELNYATRTITLAGTFTHAGGTYNATTGYVVFTGGTFNNNAAFTIPNFRYGAGAVAFTNTGMMTVSGQLDVQPVGGATWTVDNTPGAGVTSGLTINDGVLVTWTRGSITPQPIFGGTINLTLTSDGTTATLPAVIWPTAVTVNTLTVTNGAANTNMPTGTRTVATAVVHNSGTFTLPNYAAPTTDPIINVTGATYTIVTGLVQINGGSINLAASSQLNLTGGAINGAGTFAYGDAQNVLIIGGVINAVVTSNSNANITFAINGGAYGTGNELPVIVNNLSLTRTVNSVNAAVTVARNTTVNGTLDVKNDLTIPAGVTLSLSGNMTVASEAGTFAAATNPVLTFTGSLAFIGASDQIVTLLGNQGFGNVNINKAASTNSVTLVGGNMLMNVGAVITFTNGVLVTGTNALVLQTPLLGGGQGFANAFVAPNYSHVMGNVSRTTINTGVAATSSVPTIIFPVGSMTEYRPAIITFNNTTSGTPTMPNTTFTVNHQDVVATGVVGLPIANGVEPGVAVSRYPDFNWSIRTFPISVSPSIAFDIELQSAGFTDYDDINKVRLIRRQGALGDTQNQWLLQGGTNLFYDNAVISGVPAVIVRNAQAGFVQGGAVFTYGMSSRLTVDNPVANQNLEIGGAAFTVDLNNPAVFGGNQGALVYAASSTNATVATAAVAAGVLTVTPVAQGSATIQVTATDVNNDFTTTSFTVNVNPPTNFPVTGTVTYNNGTSDPFVGAVVQLWQGGAVVYTATTDAAGAFNFPAVTNGSYTMTATYAGAWPVGINASDAFAIAAHFAGTTPLTGTALAVADVNAGTTVNNTDALLIVQRFAGIINSFASGDWYFNTSSVTVNGAAVASNLVGAAYGDTRLLRSPTALPKAAAEQFAEGEILKVSPNKEFDLPISVSEKVDIGALSLAFSYPTDLVELVSVKSAKDGLLFNDVDGKVRVAWADMTGGQSSIKLDKDASVLVLTFKPTENFKAGTTFALEVDGVNELSDSKGNVLAKSGLKAASVESFVPKEFALEQNYPNPFNPSTVIEYALPENAKVTLTIYNVLGQEVTRLIDADQDAGVYKLNWNARGLASGVYIYSMKVESPNKNYTDTKRMMLLK